MSDPRKPAIPVTIVGGYLGAGKTTLVNHLLRHAGGVRLAVLVNEFGELPIDADLIVTREDDVIEIAGGCVCCSYGSDLMEALAALRMRTPRPEHVILETSGVALPGAVAASVSLIADYELDGIVVLTDCEAVERQGSDRYVGDTIVRQLEAADIVVLNKTDLVDAARRVSASDWIVARAPRARIVAAEHGCVDMHVLVGAHLATAPAAFAARMRQQHSTAAYDTFAVPAPGCYRLPALAEALSDSSLRLLRAKGFLRDADGTQHIVQVVGTRTTVVPAVTESKNAGHLVCIGIAGTVSLACIEVVLGATRVEGKTT